MVLFSKKAHEIAHLVKDETTAAPPSSSWVRQINLFYLVLILNLIFFNAVRLNGINKCDDHLDLQLSLRFTRCADVSTVITGLMLVTEAIWHCMCPLLLHSNRRCHSYIRIGLILIRIFVLWDRSTVVFRAVVAGIIIAYAACVPFLVLFARKMHGTQLVFIQKLTSPSL